MPQQDDPLSLRLQAGHPEEAARAVHPASVVHGIFGPRSHTRGKVLDPVLVAAAFRKPLVESYWPRAAGSLVAKRRNSATALSAQRNSNQCLRAHRRTAHGTTAAQSLGSVLGTEASGLRLLGSGRQALASGLWLSSSGLWALASGLGLRALAHQRIGA